MSATQLAPNDRSPGPPGAPRETPKADGTSGGKQ